MSEKTEFTQWSVVIIAVFAGILVAMQVGKVPPAIPKIRESLGIGMVSAGWVASIFNLVGACIGIAGGVFADRLGARRIIIIGFAFLILGGLAGGLSRSGVELVLSRTLAGVGIIGVVVACPRIILFASQRSHHALALGIWSAYMPVGMAIGMLITAWGVEWLGWRGIWMVNTMLLICFLSIFVYITAGLKLPSPQSSQTSLVDIIKPVISSSGPWLMGAIFGCYSLQFFALTAWLPTYLIENRGHTIAVATYFTAIIVTCNVCGNLAGTWWLHRGRPRIVLLLTSYTAMAISAAGIFSPVVSVSWKLPLALIFMFLGGLLPAAVLSAVSIHSPSRRQVGTVNGIVVQGSHIGTVSGPPLMAALVMASSGWQASMVMVALAGLFGIVFSIMLHRREQYV